MKDPRQDDDDLEERLRRDPRRDPTDPPPARPGAAPAPEIQVIDSSSRHHDAPGPHASAQAARVQVGDPRLEAVEQAIQAGAWDQVLETLGKPEDAGKLPPNLGILYAIAMKEKRREETAGAELTELAIRCSSSVLGLEPKSPIALLIAKRLLRTNPVTWRQRAAPRPWISLLIVLGGLLVGGALSFLISFGYLQVHVRLP